MLNCHFTRLNLVVISLSFFLLFIVLLIANAHAALRDVEYISLRLFQCLSILAAVPQWDIFRRQVVGLYLNFKIPNITGFVKGILVV